VAQEQLIIMRKMKNYGMIVDEQEKRIIDYCTSGPINRINPGKLVSRIEDILAYQKMSGKQH